MLYSYQAFFKKTDVHLRSCKIHHFDEKSFIAISIHIIFYRTGKIVA